MGLYLVIDEEEPQDLASTLGWGDVIRWVRGQKLPVLNHLCEHGWQDDMEGLQSEVKSALKLDPPADVASTLENLFGMMNDAQDAQVAIVTNGMT